MDAATRERLEALERQEQARNCPIVSLEIGELILGAVVELALGIPTVNGKAEKLTLETTQDFRALWVSGTELHEKIVLGRFVSEWGDDGLPAEFVELGPVQPGELVSIRRLVDKTTSTGRIMQRFAVMRPGVPGGGNSATPPDSPEQGPGTGEAAAESAPSAETPHAISVSSKDDEGIPF